MRELRVPWPCGNDPVTKEQLGAFLTIIERIDGIEPPSQLKAHMDMEAKQHLVGDVKPDLYRRVADQLWERASMTSRFFYLMMHMQSQGRVLQHLINKIEEMDYPSESIQKDWLDACTCMNTTIASIEVCRRNMLAESIIKRETAPKHFANITDVAPYREDVDDDEGQRLYPLRYDPKEVSRWHYRPKHELPFVQPRSVSEILSGLVHLYEDVLEVPEKLPEPSAMNAHDLDPLAGLDRNYADPVNLGLLINPIYAGVPPYPQITTERIWIQAQLRLLDKLGEVPYFVNLLYLLRDSYSRHFSPNTYVRGEFLPMMRAAFIDVGDPCPNKKCKGKLVAYGEGTDSYCSHCGDSYLESLSEITRGAPVYEALDDCPTAECSGQLVNHVVCAKCDFAIEKPSKQLLKQLYFIHRAIGKDRRAQGTTVVCPHCEEGWLDSIVACSECNQDFEKTGKIFVIMEEINRAEWDPEDEYGEEGEDEEDEEDEEEGR